MSYCVFLSIILIIIFKVIGYEYNIICFKVYFFSLCCFIWLIFSQKTLTLSMVLI